jgi:hypothetical protein
MSVECRLSRVKNVRIAGSVAWNMGSGWKDGPGMMGIWCYCHEFSYLGKLFAHPGPLTCFRKTHALQGGTFSDYKTTNVA